MLKRAIQKLANGVGYEIRRIQRFSGSYTSHSRVLPSHKIMDLESLANISLSIPGMVTPESGKMLYALCYMQELQGDVVEIGSWQGRSTSFLARAVGESGNGRFYAIDHFRGNVGKERHYVIGQDDLSDLKANFLSNMERVGVHEHVCLLDMPNEEAVRQMDDVSIRFLFIDGDHTKEGVQRDIRLFFPKLLDGAIVAFDDFSSSWTGLVEAVDELLGDVKPRRAMAYQNTLVIQL